MNKRQIWLAGIAAASILVLVVGWFVVISPVRSKISSTKADAASVESQNEILQTQLQQLIAQDKGVTAKQAQLSNVAAEIPGDPHLPNLIRSLTASASDSGVDLVSLTPSAPSAPTSTGGTSLTLSQPAAAAATGASTPTGASPTTAANYQTIPVALSVQGDYASLEEFVRHLEAMKRIFVVNQVTLAPSTQAGSAATANQQTPGGMVQTVHTLNATFAGAVFMTDPANTSINLPGLAAASPGAATAKP